MLAPGARLGAYEIVALVGSGGMGEVYRARDAALNRDVALKVLPQSVAADPDRIARFTREAQTLAALNHPHIAHVYGLEQSCIVMEFVDGEDLAQRLARGPVPTDESIAIARQIAEALEAAHEQGVIHRDLKPANIKLRRDGMVKVLDFGLAKLEAGGAGEAGGARGNSTHSPTLMSPAMTAAGVILGTAAYMAPEQAKGKLVDKRADIWAFGVVLYEMLTGRTLFGGESVAETIGLVVTREPDWNALPAATPPRIRALLRRCLVRDPHERLRDIGEARIALAQPDEPPPTAAARRGSTRAVAGVAALVFVIGAAAAALLFRRAAPSPAAPLRRFDLPAAIASATDGPVLARDGSRFAYIAGHHLRVQALDALDSQDLGAVPVTAANVFWSPDGRTVGYTADATIRTVAAGGGPPFVVCRIPATANAQHVLWRSDGTILVAVYRDSVYTVPATGGTPEAFLAINPATEIDFHSITELPGRRLLIATHMRDGDREQYELYDGTRRTLLSAATNVSRGFTYAPPGYLLFTRTDANRGVWAVPFAAGPLDLSKAVRVEPQATRFTSADDGTIIALIRPSGPSKAELVWTDRGGASTVAPGSPVEIGEVGLQNLELSPDGRKAVYIAGFGSSVFVRDLSSGLDTRLTFDQRHYDGPSWFPDGNRVLYLTDLHNARAERGDAGTRFIGKVVAQRADGTDSARDLAEASSLPRVSPDGKNLVFLMDDAGRRRLHVAVIAPDGSVGVPQPVFHGNDQPNVRSFDVSHDGRLLAYAAEDPSKRLDIFVTQFPAAAGRWQACSGCSFPRFSPGGELFHLSGTAGVGGEPRARLNVMPIASIPAVKLGADTPLFDIDTPESPNFGAIGFGIAADGKRILAPRMIKESGAPARRAILIQNWRAALER